MPRFSRWLRRRRWRPVIGAVRPVNPLFCGSPLVFVTPNALDDRHTKIIRAAWERLHSRHADGVDTMAVEEVAREFLSAIEAVQCPS